MGFDKWPEYFVLPDNEAFSHGNWECGTTGCAFGWLCTAFGKAVPYVRVFEDWRRLPKVHDHSPAAEFCDALIAELAELPRETFPLCLMPQEAHRANPYMAKLSDAFESVARGADVAGAWARAAEKSGGYVPVGVFE